MIIEIKKKHVIVALVCMIIGIVIGVSGLLLIEKHKESEASNKEIITTTSNSS